MQLHPACPLCGATTWQIIGERRYAQSDLPKLNEYVRKRYRVLFERWAVGQDVVDYQSGMCSACGFVSNLPRPDEREIDAKYRFLAELGQDYGRDETPEVQRSRSRALYTFLRSSITRGGNILDFGGGDGRLMRTFAEEGHECFLVDYNDSPKPYVRKLGDTIDEVPDVVKFGGIVCSHVIEHVAGPVDILRQLADRLKRPGVLFVEVPMEIWGRAPLSIEPVTHVNFFVPATLSRCAAEAALRVTCCRLVSSLHPTGKKKAAIRLVADNGAGPSGRPLDGISEVRRFLNPGWGDRMRYGPIVDGGPHRWLGKRLTRWRKTVNAINV